MPSKLKSFLLWYGFAGVLLLVCLTQLHLLPGSGTENPDGYSAMKPLLLLLAPAAIWLSVRTMPANERWLVWTLSLFAASLCEVVHYWCVDKGHFFPAFAFRDNTAWQIWMHSKILDLDPALLPHSYRFLPDCIVAIFQRLGGEFEFARLAYRLLADSLLFSVIFRYARVYLSAISSTAVILLLVMVYPVTILRYAGQLTDPASHLTFAICLYCLATGNEAGFGASLLVGVFAKESILVMAVCRAFYGSSRRGAVGLAAIYFAGATALAVAIRLGVNHGTISYTRISGPGLSHVLNNLGQYTDWGPLWLVSLGLFLPGTLLGWRWLEPAFKATALVMTFALVLSSLFFSWLREVRNLVPAFIPLAVASLKYLEVQVSVTENRRRTLPGGDALTGA